MSKRLDFECIKGLEDKVASLQATLAEQAREIERKRQDMDAMLMTLAMASREIAQLTTILSDVTADANLSHQQIARLEEEIERLRGWIGDLQSGLYINCVYCGFRYGPGESTPATLPEAGETLAATALREHAERCPDHPMSRLKKEIKRLLEALKTTEGYIRYAPPTLCDDCIRGMECVFVPSCATRDRNYQLALQTVGAALRATPEVPTDSS